MFTLLLEMASDCHELFMRGETTSGIYTIQPINAEPFKVFCEMKTGKPILALWVLISSIVLLLRQSVNDLAVFPDVLVETTFSDQSVSVFLFRWRMDSDPKAPRWLS